MTKEKQSISFDIRKQWPVLLLTLLLIAEFIFIIWINIFHISDTIDEDFSGMLTHALEIAKQKKFLLPNWFYPTTGEFDTSLFLAVPLFWITRNIYLSFAVVNILNAVLIGYVFFRVLRLAGAKVEYALVGMCVALAAYDFGMLDYSNMLFFGGSQYVYKAVLPLLFLAVLFGEKSLKNKKVILDLCLFYGLFFLSSFSSGIYVFLCGICPVLLSLIVIGIATKTNESLYRKWLIIQSAVTCAVALVGVILHSAAGLEMHSFNSSLMRLRNGMTFPEALGEVVDSFVSVINPITDDLIDAISFTGMAGGMKWLMLAMVCLGFAFIPGAFGFEYVGGKKSAPSVRDRIAICSISVFVFNFFILLITVSKSRYHLIGFFALIICAILHIEDRLKESAIFKEGFLIAVFIMYACLEIANITYHAPRYFAHEGLKSYYLDEKFCSQVKECADNLGVSTVFFANVVEDAEIMRLYDDSRHYETYVGETRQVYNYDSHIRDLDKSSLDDRNIMLVTEEGYDTLPGFIRDFYVKIDHIGKYDVFMCDYSAMDGGSYIYRGEKTIDLPVSPGYKYDGDVGVEGYLFSVTEGNLLTSPAIRAKKPFTYTFNYDLDSSDGTEATLEVYKNGELCDSRKLEGDEHSISVELEGHADYTFVVNKEGSGVIVIREMEFEGH